MVIPRMNLCDMFFPLMTKTACIRSFRGGEKVGRQRLERNSNV